MIMQQKTANVIYKVDSLFFERQSSKETKRSGLKPILVSVLQLLN